MSASAEPEDGAGTADAGTAAAEPAKPGGSPPEAAAKDEAAAQDRGAVADAGAAAGGTAAPPEAPALNTGGLLYGTIVSAAALAVGATRGDTAGGMFETMVATLVIYWLAHIYTATVTARQPGSTVPLHRLVRTAAKHESPILIGGLPAVAVVAILSLSHVSLWVTVLSDLATVIVVLALDGLLAGLYAGTRGWRLGVEAGSAAVLGGVLAALLVTLHH